MEEREISARVDRAAKALFVKRGKDNGKWTAEDWDKLTTNMKSEYWDYAFEILRAADGK